MATARNAVAKGDGEGAKYSDLHGGSGELHRSWPTMSRLCHRNLGQASTSTPLRLWPRLALGSGPAAMPRSASLGLTSYEDGNGLTKARGREVPGNPAGTFRERAPLTIFWGTESAGR